MTVSNLVIDVLRQLTIFASSMGRTGRSAEDDEVHNVTSASGGNSHERRSTSAMRVLFAGDVDGGSRSNAASRLTGGRSGRRNATFGDELPPPPPPPPSSSNGDGSARTSGVTSGRNNKMCCNYRVIIDLMPMLVDYREYSKSTYSHISKMLELNDSIVAAVRREIEERLCPTWRWMESILDRTEAQLRFGNALM
uniref:Uncharacterized protein n=1 Tax=Parascaris equorum TaxID=6256 RepID=A0A914RE30_PAREQ